MTYGLYGLCGHRFKPAAGAMQADRRWYGMAMTNFYQPFVTDEASFGDYLLMVEQDDARRAEADKIHQEWLNRPRGFWARLFS